MDIEEQKKKFLDLLRTAYKAGLTTNQEMAELGMAGLIGIPDPEQVSIKKATLARYGFNNPDFWDIICPSLKEDGYLKSYDAFMCGYQDFYNSIPAYKNLTEKIFALNQTLPRGYALHRADAGQSLYKANSNPYDPRGTGGRYASDIEKEIDKLEEDLDAVEKKELANYPHVFVVNAEKLLDSSDKTIPETIYISPKKGIYIDDKRRYPISGKRLECVQKFLESDSLTKEDLEQFWSTSSQITNEIKEINTITRKKLGIEHDLITHSTSDRSYSLNQEKLKILAS